MTGLLLCEFLEDAGLRATAVEDVPSALCVLGRRGGEHPIRLLVTDTDLGLRRLAGLALAAEARRHLPGLRVLYLTSSPGRFTGHALGMDERLLGKPFDPDTLMAAVRDLVGLPRVTASTAACAVPACPPPCSHPRRRAGEQHPC